MLVEILIARIIHLYERISVLQAAQGDRIH